MNTSSDALEFDLAKEQRTDRVKWVLVGGTLLLAVARFFVHFPVYIFQVFLATTLCYGNEFYRERGNFLRSSWLWKAFLTTLPIHGIYLGVLFWSGLKFPAIVTKPIIFIPLLVLCFGVEALIFDRVILTFEPRNI